MEAVSALGYRSLVFLHLLLFVLWLGADVGVFLLGQHFRRRQRYSLPQRVAMLRMLVLIDLTPRVAWALMVPLSLSVVRAGGFWDMPAALLAGAWAVAACWIWLVLDAHHHDQTPRAARNRRIEAMLRYALTLFYLWLGASSLLTGAPLAPHWLAAKALLFGLIFAAAIGIDLAFRPVGPLLGRLLAEGSSDATELPLLRAMNRTRIFVWTVYLLLLLTAWLGTVQPVF